MLRLCIVLLCITAISLALAWIGDEPGRVTIDWAEYHIETSVLVLIAGASILAACCSAFYALFYLLLRAPRHWSRSRLAKRQMLGLEALTEAFAALATQDTIEAKKQIARAQLHLPHQPLPLMLAAQVARAEGNESQSRLYLEQMSKTKASGFLALRGLMENARRLGDHGTALRHGEQALALKPQDPRLIVALVGSYVKDGRIHQALSLLENASRKRYVEKQEARKLSAYALYENAQNLLRHHREDFAIAVLQDVVRKLPDFTPAIATLADTYVKKGEGKRAIKVLMQGWKILPHPLLTTSLLACFDAGIDRALVLAAAKKMAKMHPDAYESLLLSAEISLRKRELNDARSTLRHLAHKAETRRVCILLAETERLNGNHEQAADWLKRASDAAPDPAWICENCRHSSALWHFICEQCGSVGMAEWK